MLSSVEVFAMALKMRFALSKHSNQQIEIAKIKALDCSLITRHLSLVRAHQQTQKLIALEYTPPKDGTA
jgi:hypothetical protein